MGSGGTIPLMNILKERYPKARFIVTGVLGPGSNAHGPNENLDMPFVQKLIGVIAGVIAGVYENFKNWNWII